MRGHERRACAEEDVSYAQDVADRVPEDEDIRQKFQACFLVDARMPEVVCFLAFRRIRRKIFFRIDAEFHDRHFTLIRHYYRDITSESEQIDGESCHDNELPRFPSRFRAPESVSSERSGKIAQGHYPPYEKYGRDNENDIHSRSPFLFMFFLKIDMPYAVCQFDFSSFL